MAEPNKQRVEEVKVTASEAEKANAARTSRIQADEEKARTTAAAADDGKSDEERQAEEDERKRAEEEAAAQAKRDESRKNLVEEIAGSDEGFVTRSDSNGEAIDQAFADGYLYNSNTQKGIEVEERYFLTQKGYDTRQS